MRVRFIFAVVVTGIVAASVPEGTEEDDGLLQLKTVSYTNMEISQTLTDHYCKHYCGDVDAVDDVDAMDDRCHFKKVVWNDAKKGRWVVRDVMCSQLCAATPNSDDVCERNNQGGNVDQDLCESNTYFPNGAEGPLPRRAWMDRVAADFCQTGCDKRSAETRGTACSAVSDYNTDPRAEHICDTYCSWQLVQRASGAVMKSWEVLNPGAPVGSSKTCMRKENVADLCDPSATCIANYLAVQRESVLTIGDRCGCNGDCNQLPDHPDEKKRYCEGWTLHNCCAPGVGFGRCSRKKEDGADCFTSAECLAGYCHRKLGRLQCR